MDVARWYNGRVRRLRSGTAALALAFASLGCGEGAGGPLPVPSPTPPPAADPLRDAAGRLLVGAAVQTPALSDPRYVATFERHFNYVVAEYEMKWDPIERVMDAPDFAGADRIVALAEARGMRVKGHALVWHGAVPAWVPPLSPPELRVAVDQHLRAVLGRYRGRVHAWDVVNEAVADDGSGLRDTVFRRGLGDDYVAEAFRRAHELDPEALLFYNDYGAEGLGPKSDRVYELVRDLVRRGVPIHGVGLQMHLDASSFPAPASIAANLRRLAELGLRLEVSEMDVRVRTLPGDRAARLEQQRRVYHDVVALCVAEPRCQAAVFWGFTDAHSWIDGFFGPDDPLLFDEQYAPKPAFFGVRDALAGR
jgi:endo-1,4-beta-xylanase